MNTLQVKDQNKQTVSRLYEEVFNNGELTSIDLLIDNEIGIHDPVMGELRGIEAFRQFASVFHIAFPQQHTTVEDLVAEDDLVAALHTHTGLNTGSFIGMPPTGRSISVRGLELFRLRDGKITELWRHDDDAGLMRQLGIVPAPAAASH